MVVIVIYNCTPFLHSLLTKGKKPQTLNPNLGLILKLPSSSRPQEKAGQPSDVAGHWMAQLWPERALGGERGVIRRLMEVNRF